MRQSAPSLWLVMTILALVDGLRQPPGQTDGILTLLASLGNTVGSQCFKLDLQIGLSMFTVDHYFQHRRSCFIINFNTSKQLIPCTNLISYIVFALMTTITSLEYGTQPQGAAMRRLRLEEGAVRNANTATAQ